MIESVSPRLGIKSSLPDHLQAFVTAYLIWRTNDKPVVIEYSEEYINSDGLKKIKFKNTILNALDRLLSTNTNYDSKVFDTSPLLMAQIEHLQVGLLNCYKVAYTTHLDIKLSNSCERSGGNRYDKKLEYTSFIDLFNCFVEHSLDDYLDLFILILNKGDFVSHKFFRQFSGFISFLVEQTKYKLADDTERDRLYQKFEGTIDFFKNGPSRILKPFTNNGLYDLYPNSTSLTSIELRNKKSRIDNLFNIFSVNYDNESRSEDEETDTESNPTSREIKGYNKIIYGAPGAGKSASIKRFIEENTTEILRDKNYIRTVFHPETQYSDFIGCLKPHKDSSGSITYSFRKGPFIQILEKALLDKKNHYFLVIEELNRANTAAVFGEIFQLLDRDNKGNSEYPILIQDEDLYYALKGTLGSEHEFIVKRQLMIPNNLSIIATMNSSDQAVFPLDTAFKRRWIFEYLPIDFTNCATGKVPIYHTGLLKVEWKTLAQTINTVLCQLKVVEDKLIGPWFIKDSDLVEDQAEQTFIGKICSYLWDDALKYKNKDEIFRSDIHGYGELYQRYSDKKPIFSDKFMEILQNTQIDDIDTSEKPETE
ncbi:AAA family ATPase [Acinetobacter baumannii]|uniref:McrB family protein n=1 Tax=Acinetobacter baumannii TaxID=470 RepID=UPI00295C01D4|nr:AAA family ATPase [Acinetobacter baumannii]